MFAEIKIKDWKKVCKNFDINQKFLVYIRLEDISEIWHVVLWDKVSGFFVLDSFLSFGKFYGNRIHPTEVDKIFVLPSVMKKNTHKDQLITIGGSD